MFMTLFTITAEIHARSLANLLLSICGQIHCKFKNRANFESASESHGEIDSGVIVIYTTAMYTIFNDVKSVIDHEFRRNPVST